LFPEWDARAFNRVARVKVTRTQRREHASSLEVHLDMCTKMVVGGGGEFTKSRFLVVS
jgi:hypothetical protein